MHENSKTSGIILIEALNSRKLLTLKFGEQELVVTPDQIINTGGTKHVISVEADGHWAVALPRKVADWEGLIDDEVLETERLRDLGLMVNDQLSVREVTVNGIDVKALWMVPFSKMPFLVIDVKNVESWMREGFVQETGFENDEVIDEEWLDRKLSSAVDDLMVLREAGLYVPRDCINLCVIDGEIRVFFFDLGGNVYQEEWNEQMLKSALTSLSGGLMNALPWDYDIDYDLFSSWVEKKVQELGS